MAIPQLAPVYAAHLQSETLDQTRRIAQTLQHLQAEYHDAHSSPQPANAPQPRAPTSHNLPAATTPLIGRDADVAHLCHIVRDGITRLVTVTGPGGAGKTRVSLEVAHALCSDFSDGVFWVGLENVVDPAHIVPAIARSLAIPLQPERNLDECLRLWLRDRHLLFYLDNFEQVVAAAPIVADLLAAAPHLVIIISSRVVLRLRGEYEYSVQPLALPDPHAPLSPHVLVEYGATTLFVARAQAARPDFCVTAINAPIIAAICTRLDGLPLAIELAAARCNVLTLEAILARLDRRLPLLTGGARDVPYRQQTLRDAIKWSYDLLSEEAARLFVRLAVFCGGCNLAAIEQLDNGDVLPALTALVESSLVVRVVTDSSEPRYTMLETIREFAAELLVAAPDVAKVRAGHSAYFVGLAQAAEAGLAGADQAQWLDTLDRDLDNIRVALRRMLAQADPAEAGRMATALFMFWRSRGYVREGRAYLEAALAHHDLLPPDVHAAAAFCAGFLAVQQGENTHAITLYDSSLRLYRQLGDDDGLARVLNGRGIVALEQGEYVQAAQLLETAVRLRRKTGHRQGIAICLQTLGEVARVQADYGRAIACYNESLHLFRILESDHGLGTCAALCYLGRAYCLTDDIALARRDTIEGLRLAHTLNHQQGIAFCLETLAVCAADGTIAATLFGMADHIRTRIGVIVPPNEHVEYRRMFTAARARTTAEGWANGWARATTLTVADSIAIALGAPSF